MGPLEGLSTALEEGEQAVQSGRKVPFLGEKTSPLFPFSYSKAVGSLMTVYLR